MKERIEKRAIAERPVPEVALLPFLARVFVRSLRTVARGGVVGALFWPTVAAAVIWLTVALVGWGPLSEALLAWVETYRSGSEGSAAGSDGLPWWAVAVVIGVKMALWLGLIPLVYVTAMVIIGVWVLPRLVREIAARDYPNLGVQPEGTVWQSLGNTLRAAGLYFVGLLGALLLWWLPGALVALPFLLTGWFNMKTTAYDCLCEVASPRECEGVIGSYRGPLFVVGLAGAALVWVPVVNLFAPVLVGIFFTHASLSLLDLYRSAHGEWELIDT
ncbi:MAG: EI24 domain-containing protein [Hydrogenophilus sp.]|nr:EI24 domain-containing protein [Hydrogenophilus sp.]